MEIETSTYKTTFKKVHLLKLDNRYVIINNKTGEEYADLDETILKQSWRLEGNKPVYKYTIQDIKAIENFGFKPVVRNALVKLASTIQ